MLKLATLPRSRRERDWWRATPGRSGKGAALPLPAESPAERTEVCVTWRVPNSAILECRVPNSARLERRSHIGIRHARRPERARATTQAARAGRPEPVEHDGTRRRCGSQRATSEDTAGGSRRCLNSPNGRRRDPVHPRAGRSRSPHARRLGANVDQRQDRGKGQGRGRCGDRRLAAQDAVRRHGLRPDGQNAPPPPCISKGCATSEVRVDRGNLGPHETAEEPMLVRAPSPAFFAREDQVLDLR